jgi:hypothetical protein
MAMTRRITPLAVALCLACGAPAAEEAASGEAADQATTAEAAARDLLAGVADADDAAVARAVCLDAAARAYTAAPGVNGPATAEAYREAYLAALYARLGPIAEANVAVDASRIGPRPDGYGFVERLPDGRLAAAGGVLGLRVDGRLVADMGAFQAVDGDWCLYPVAGP